MLRHRHIPTLLLALLAAALAAGCKKELPKGSPAAWLEDATALEEQGDYFQEDREQAPLGALEYYRLCLEAAPGTFNEERMTQIRQRVQWLSALKLVLTEDFMGKCDYQGAIAAMTQFLKDWPDSPYSRLALFYRGLAREYDVDYQDTAGAIADYQAFLENNPDDPLAPEVRVRIGHCYEFDLDKPDYDKAIETYDDTIAKYGPKVEELNVRADDVTDVEHLPELMAVERALYNKARILEDHLAQTRTDQPRDCYEQAAECYHRLMDERFFGTIRFKQSQFVYFRYAVLLAEKLDRPQEGIDVLKTMEKRWPESPMYGRAKWKREQIEKTVAAAKPS